MYSMYGDPTKPQVGSMYGTPVYQGANVLGSPWGYGGGGGYPSQPAAPAPAPVDYDKLFNQQMALINAQNAPQMAQLKQSAALSSKLLPMLKTETTGGGTSYPYPAPNFTVGPVWNPQQIQQQTNASRAQADMRAATQSRNMLSGVGARGFSPTSPLIQAMQSNIDSQNLIANSTADREIAWNAAQGNAQHTLAGESAREQAVSQRFGDITAGRAAFTSALLSALAGII